MNTSDVSDKWKRPTAIHATNITAVDPPGVSGSYQFPVGKTIVRWVAVNAIGDQDVCLVHVDVTGEYTFIITTIIWNRVMKRRKIRTKLGTEMRSRNIHLVSVKKLLKV